MFAWFASVNIIPVQVQMLQLASIKADNLFGQVQLSKSMINCAFDCGFPMLSFT